MVDEDEVMELVDQLRFNFPEEMKQANWTMQEQQRLISEAHSEAARIMAWDKRRVVTYIHRGSFPAPIQSLASGRVWRRDDVEDFAAAWRARQVGRRRR